MVVPEGHERQVGGGGPVRLVVMVAGAAAGGLVGQRVGAGVVVLVEEPLVQKSGRIHLFGRRPEVTERRIDLLRKSQGVKIIGPAYPENKYLWTTRTILKFLPV